MPVSAWLDDAAPVRGWLQEVSRTTTARLTVLYGLIFAFGILALLGVVYWQSELYLNHRVDRILKARADVFLRATPADLPRLIREGLAVDGAQINVYALLSRDGAPLEGNLRRMPAGLTPDGASVDLPPTADFPAQARLIARRLPWGEILVVGRDVSQLTEMRAIVLQALGWSAVVIILTGLVLGASLSLNPLRRVRALQAACREIGDGDLRRRMPVSSRHDELDMFAATVNHTVEEVERLMAEVKGATETIAHDLRTPLTRARARLSRLEQSLGEADPRAEDALWVIDELDAVLGRFTAILRISELEARRRREGFVATDPADLARQAADLYGPLAEARGVSLETSGEAGGRIEADPKLLFEALSNLVDNAIKFTPAGGRVEVRAEAGPRIVVQDNGPGVPEAEQAAVLQRFYRGERDRLTPGSGLGLSIVAAIVRLHGFHLRLEDADPGLRAVIDCAPHDAGLPA
ncbi:MAG TPA: HAMP domain-containing sensor histidine kinase [Caulobacteraceae bacterium]|jgi:signal transduction histidine kinase